MTIICWDGITLAADKMMDCNGYPATTTKIKKAPNGDLLGASGDADTCRSLIDWYCCWVGTYPQVDFPENCRSQDNLSKLIVITETGKINMYYRAPKPIFIEDKFFAIGSGADFALATMHLGFDARKAVEVAIALDNSCGNGIDTLMLQKNE